jgi:iron complex outermembrane receptor protein
MCIKENKDLLLYTQNPSFFGFSNFDNYNVGLIENKGIEIAADVLLLEQQLILNIGGNVTSKFTKLTTTLPDTPGINVGGYEGQEITKSSSRFCPNYVYERCCR